MVTQATRQTSTQRRLFTIEEYEQMIDAGVFDEDERVELIEGEILKMSPINWPHESCVNRLTLILNERLHRAGIVSPQNSIRIHGKSRPEPDIVVLKWSDRLYLGVGEPPTVRDVLLLIEVSLSSLKYDRGKKLRIYARAGVSHVWVVDLWNGAVEVYSDPEGGEYREVHRAERGETLRVPTDREVIITVDEVLGGAVI